jgi:hypothetical protein
MKTFFSDLIPKFQQFSQKLDNLSLLTDKPWVIINGDQSIKEVFIFRSNNELLISKNGSVTKAKWEYLGYNTLIIDIHSESYLFKQGFFDSNILILKIDSKNDYVFLVNEILFDNEINSIDGIISLLNKYYPNDNKILVNTKKEIDYYAPLYQINKEIEFYPFLESKTICQNLVFEDGHCGQIFAIIKTN